MRWIRKVRGLTNVQAVIAMFATLGIGAFVLWLLFGAINYVKGEMSNSGVNFTAPQSLENSITTTANLSGVGLTILAIVAIISVVATLLYVLRER